MARPAEEPVCGKVRAAPIRPGVRLGRVGMFELSDARYDSRVLRAARSIASAGYDVDLFMYNDALASSRVIVDGNLTTHEYAFPLRRRSENGRLRVRRALAALGILTRMHAAILNGNWDVWHAHNLYFLWSSVLSARAHGGSVIYDAHELHCEHHPSESAKGRLLNRLNEAYERFLVNYCDAFIEASDDRADYIARRYAVPKPDVVGNYVPMHAAYAADSRIQRECHLPVGSKVIFYSGNVGSGRGRRLDTVVEALAHLPEPVHLVVLGSMNDVVRQRLIAHAVRCGVSGRTHVLPPCSQDDLPGYAASAHVGVIPLEGRNMNTVLSALNKMSDYLMAGLPVVASDYPNLRAQILQDPDGTVGAVFDVRSPTSIAQAVSAVLEDPAYDAVRARARHLAETSLNWESQEKALLAVYRRLAESSGRPSKVQDLRERSRRSSPPTTAEWAAAAGSAIWRRLEAHAFAGSDPYDALNARRVPSTVLRHAAARRVLTQAVKHSPVRLQPVIGVPEHVDAYTLGHALLAASRLAAVDGGSEWPAVCGHLRTLLRESATQGDNWSAWGYHFPVHTRFFSYEASTPNVVVTAFAAKGLAAATRSGLVDAREELSGAARFILSQLARVIDSTGQCFSYLPHEPAAVHNANLLAALVLCEAGELCGEEAWVGEALSSARFAIARQAPDGSWPYSEEPYGRWVDGFHTGFVLEGLARVLAATGEADVRTALERGLALYVAQLFGPSGEPKYYPHRAFPLDALSAAQGVETLHVAVGGPASRAVPGQLDWIRRHLVRPDGRVAYQVHRGWTDWREFPRWSSAPLMSALAGRAAEADA